MSVRNSAYSDMATLLQANDFIFQQDGVPPHWHLGVQAYLNENLPQRWIGRRGAGDFALLAWPAKFPDLTVCDFFLWGMLKKKLKLYRFQQISMI